MDGCKNNYTLLVIMSVIVYYSTCSKCANISVSFHVTFHQPLYTVTRLVRMEGLWMQELVCVTVQMASVGQIVKVSTLREAQGNYVLLDVYSIMQQ